MKLFLNTFGVIFESKLGKCLFCFLHPPLHFSRFWGSGRLENHLKIMLNLFENHLEKELRFDVIFLRFWAHFRRPERLFRDQNLKKNAFKF